MAVNLNRAQLIGRLGKDPEIKRFEKGMVANLAVATSKQWKDKDGSQKEKTEWHNISVFNEFIVSFVEKFCKKGDVVFCEGEIQYRKYTDKAGVEKTATEIVISKGSGNVQLCQSKKREEADELDRTLAAVRPKKANEDADLDAIPF